MTIRSLAAILCLLAVGCPSGSGGGGIQRVEQARLVKVITADDAKVLDPHVTSDGGNVKVILQVYETLVRVDPDDVNELVPALAERWEVAPDGLAITFHLRPDVTFHDGTPFDAAAAKLSLERVRGQGFELPSAPYAPEFAHVAGIEAADPKTLVVKLDAPVARVMLRNLSMFCASIVSPKVLDASRAGDRASDAAAASDHVSKHAAGTGPFRVDAFDPSAKITRLVANSAYWGGEPQVQTLLFQPVADESSRYEHLQRSSDLLLVDEVPRQHWDAVEASDSLALHRVWGLNVAYLGIHASHEATREPEVRRAIQLAIDRDKLLGHYEGTARATYSLVAQPMGEYDPELRVEGWKDDPAARIAAAKQLVADAGATGREVTVYFPVQPRPYLPRPQDIADAVRQQLKAIGLDARIQGEDKNKLFPGVPTGQYELVLIGWMTDNGDPDNFYSPLADGSDGQPGESNVSRVFDPEVHEKLLAAQRLQDAGERVAAYREVERLLQERVRGYVPLVNTQQALGYSKRLEGLEIDPLGHYRFHRARVVEN